MEAIEAVGRTWAEWVKDRGGPVYDKDHGYSLGDSILANKEAFAGIGGETGLETAKGVHTHTRKPASQHEWPATVTAWEAGMANLKKSNPILWSVGVAYYLGEVPIGFRSAHRQRRRRFRLDDGTGMILQRHETLTPIEGEGRIGWKRRIGRRLLMVPRTFDLKLQMFHERMSGWVEAKIPRVG